ncbi:UbiA prenyltransferase family domain containing protein [Elaphomyces granulatus]
MYTSPFLGSILRSQYPKTLRKNGAILLRWRFRSFTRHFPEFLSNSPRFSVSGNVGRLRPHAEQRVLIGDEHCLRKLNIHNTSTSTNNTPHSAIPAAGLDFGYYLPPQNGFIAYLPKSWVPYAELVRFDKPTGTYYLFFPCLFSTLSAAPLGVPIANPINIMTTVGLFFAGSLVMRGAGCTINDLWDRNLDPHVERTRLRPIARGAVTAQNAIIFTGFQLLTGLGILVQFPTQCLLFGVPSLFLVAIYPLAKRVTNYPQFVLGLTFSWGAIMGFPALGLDLLVHHEALGVAVALYSSCVAWTVLYDMIYAHMDIKDDLAVGIKSIALRHEHNTKIILSCLAVTQVALLAAAGAAGHFGPIFFLGSCGSAIVSLGVMIWRVQLKDVKNCWWWFKNGCWITGGGISLGMIGEYLAQFWGLYDRKSASSIEMVEQCPPSDGL